MINTTMQELTMLGIKRLPKDPDERAARKAEIKAEWRDTRDEGREAFTEARQSFADAGQHLAELHEAVTNSFAGVTINGNAIAYQGTIYPLAGAHATVETTGQITQRISVTRMVGLGIFSLAAPKKKDRRELYLHVETASGEFVVQVNPDKGAKARQFAARINTKAAEAAAQAEVAAQPFLHG